MRKVTDGTGTQTGRTWLRAIRLLPLLAIAVLASCQSGTDLGVTAKDAKKASAPASTAMVQPAETIGQGDFLVTMVTAAAAPGADLQSILDRTDGAKLAVENLGSKILTLDIRHTDGQATSLQALGAQIAAGKSQLVVASLSPEQLQALATGYGKTKMVTVALASNAQAVPAGVRTFFADPVDNVLEASSFAVASGRKKMLVISASDMAAPQVTKLKQQMAQLGPAVMGYATADPASGRLLSGADMVAGADAYVLLGRPDSLGPILSVSGLNAQVSKPGKSVVLPTLLTVPANMPVVQAETVFCRFDQDVQSLMGNRYMRRYGRPVSIDAAYGYDLMALSAGLARTASTRERVPVILSSPSGFRGVLGLFRFTDNGRIQRSCGIYKLQGRGIEPFHKAPDSF